MKSYSAVPSYDNFYFAHDCGRPYQRDEVWLRFFATIADRVVSDIRPCTVLDAGCAIGSWWPAKTWIRKWATASRWRSEFIIRAMRAHTKLKIDWLIGSSSI